MSPAGRPTEVEDLLRRNAPQVLGALVRRYGHFDAAEDAVQEALLAAAGRWPSAGVPDNPRNPAAARAAYESAAAKTLSLPERRYLQARAARLRP